MIIKNTFFVRFLLLLLIFIINISYSPVFFDTEGNSTFPYKWIIEILAVLFLLLSFLYSPPKSKFIWNYFTFSIVIVAAVLVYYSLELNVSIGEIREVLIPFMALSAGSYIYKTIKDRSFYRILICISVGSAIIVGLQQIFINIGGWVIKDLYLASSKNSLGGLLAINAVLAGVELFGQSEKNRLYKLFLSSCIIVLIVEMLTIRSRLDLIVALFVLSIAYFRYADFKKNNYKVIASVVLLVALILLLTLNSVQDYIQSSFFQNREDDVLSGRYERLTRALEVIESKPFTGNLFVYEYVPWVHNYLVLKIFNFGFLLGLPWILMYFYIFIYIVKQVIKAKVLLPTSFGFLLVLVPFIISIGEPTFPYGPGTVNYVPYLFLGLSVEHLTKTDN